MQVVLVCNYNAIHVKSRLKSRKTHKKNPI